MTDHIDRTAEVLLEHGPTPETDLAGPFTGRTEMTILLDILGATSALVLAWGAYSLVCVAARHEHVVGEHYNGRCCICGLSPEEKR